MVDIKSFIKKALLISLIFLSSFACKIYANEIKSIDVEAVLNEDGSANITEIWSTVNDDGTEWFIPRQNLNHMKLKNFAVKDGNGNDFKFVQHWNVDDSFDEKKYKCGINHTSEGIELCFGKSNMGENKYILTYVYENFVQNFPDMDGFNIRFINDQMDPAPQKVSVKISTNTKLNQNNAKIWAFGYGGNIEFKDGYVYAYNTEDFYGNDNVTILMGINKGVLNPTYKGKGTFNDLKSRALQGSNYQEDSGSSGSASEYGGFDKNSLYKPNIFRRIINFIKRAGLSLIPAVVVVLQILIAIFADLNKKPANFRKIKRNYPQYYRDDILNRFLPAIYYISSIQMNQNGRSDLIASYFLKWIKEGTVKPLDEEFRKTEGGFLGFGKHSKLNLYINDLKKCDSDGERKLYDMFKEAAGEDNTLVYNELYSYFKHKYKKFSKIMEYIEKEGENYLFENGYLVKKKKFLLNKKYFTESGINEVQNLYAMRRFLKQFTLINEKTPIEVKLWDDYLIIATMIGIGEQVMKSFGELYPEYRYAGDYSPNMVYYVSHNTGRKSYSTYEAQVRSSGRGGSSSHFGGGGGFSGGGSGGGSR